MMKFTVGFPLRSYELDDCSAIYLHFCPFIEFLKHPVLLVSVTNIIRLSIELEITLVSSCLPPNRATLDIPSKLVPWYYVQRIIKLVKEIVPSILNSFIMEIAVRKACQGISSMCLHHHNSSASISQWSFDLRLQVSSLCFHFINRTLALLVIRLFFQILYSHPTVDLVMTEPLLISFSKLSTRVTANRGEYNFVSLHSQY